MALCQLAVDPARKCTQITMPKWVVSEFHLDDHSKQTNKNNRILVEHTNLFQWCVHVWLDSADEIFERKLALFIIIIIIIINGIVISHMYANCGLRQKFM